jgi:hypothetical protein
MPRHYHVHIMRDGHDIPTDEDEERDLLESGL